MTCPFWESKSMVISWVGHLPRIGSSTFQFLCMESNVENKVVKKVCAKQLLIIQMATKSDRKSDTVIVYICLIETLNVVRAL